MLRRLHGDVSLTTNDVRRPVINVIDVPISTYQVNAMGVAKRTYNISASPATMPHIAAISPTRRVSNPSRNTPSSEP